MGPETGRGLPCLFSFALHGGRLTLQATVKRGSVDLRAPRDVIDGRLRRVIPRPGKATEGESRACGLMRRFTVSLRKGERMRAQPCSQGSPEGDDVEQEKNRPALLPCDLVNSPIDPVREIVESFENRGRGSGKSLVHLANDFTFELLESKVEILLGFLLVPR